MQLRTFISNWKITLPWGLVFVLVTLLVLQVYHSLEQAVTLDNEHQLSLAFQGQSGVLRTIVEPFVKGFTKARLIKLLVQNKIKHFVNEYNFVHTMDEIVAGQVAFYFDKDKLVRVEVDQNLDKVSQRMPDGSK